MIMLLAIAAVLLLLFMPRRALACTAIYVGSKKTKDNSTIFARSEDLSNSYNKRFFFAPAGVHKAGEEYKGCCFSYTFTRDSYSYTAFSDDNGPVVEHVCPSCGESHYHIPFEAAGTNEMGLSVTATESLRGSETMREADPCVENGISESEIATVLLSECATAKEALALLTKIYDTAGCRSGAGVFISDHSETWYVENVTGRQYIGFRCTPDLAFAVPNQSVIGLVNLNDTENIVASKGIIEAAKQAGAFVGSEEDNTINYVASYNAEQVANARMVSALHHFNNAYTCEEPAAADYTVSNVDAEGNIVPIYSNITLDRAFGIEDIVGYYAIPGIGVTGNLDMHAFQVYEDDSLTDTVEWVAMDHGCYNVFIPYYPMLTTDTYAAYQTYTARAPFTEEDQADAEIHFPTSVRRWSEEEGIITIPGFRALPENWRESYYWTFDALSNLMESTEVSEEKREAVKAKLAELQQNAYAAFAEMKEAVAKAENKAEASAIATEISMRTAKNTHEAVIKLVEMIK